MRLLYRLRYGKPCGNRPPWTIEQNAKPCIIRSKVHNKFDNPHWHADGYGYIWNHVIGSWRWMGPEKESNHEGLPQR